MRQEARREVLQPAITPETPVTLPAAPSVSFPRNSLAELAALLHKFDSNAYPIEQAQKAARVIEEEAPSTLYWVRQNKYSLRGMRQLAMEVRNAQFGFYFRCGLSNE